MLAQQLSLHNRRSPSKQLTQRGDFCVTEHVYTAGALQPFFSWHCNPKSLLTARLNNFFLFLSPLPVYTLRLLWTIIRVCLGHCFISCNISTYFMLSSCLHMPFALLSVWLFVSEFAQFCLSTFHVEVFKAVCKDILPTIPFVI